MNRYRLIILVSIFLLHGCIGGQEIKPTHHDNAALIIYHPTNVNDIYDVCFTHINSGSQGDCSKHVSGLAAYSQLTKQEAYQYIDILFNVHGYIRLGHIYAAEPQYRQDMNMLILGEEFWHVLRGDWHE